MYTGVFYVKQGASMSAIYVNNNIEAFTELIHKTLGSLASGCYAVITH